MALVEIVLSPAAERDIKKLQVELQRATFESLRKLRDGSENLDIEKIKGHPNFYRLRAVKGLRIIYHPLSADCYVILTVCDRKDAYRNLGALSNKLNAALSRFEMEPDEDRSTATG